MATEGTRTDYAARDPADVEAPALREEAVAEVIDELRQRRLGPSRVGGWPIHGRTSNTCPGAAWLSLWTLASDDAAGWSWADGQFLEVYVRREGLATRGFEPAYGYAS